MSLVRFFDRRVNQQAIEKSLKFLLFDRFKVFITTTLIPKARGLIVHD